MIDTLALSDELERYVGHLRSDGSASVRTVATVRHVLSEFLDWAEKAGVKEPFHPTFPKLERYLSYLGQTHMLSSSEHRAKLEIVAAFYEWLCLFGHFPEKSKQGVYIVGA